ncbi:MAG: CHASE2 domain-containing protein, partial [Betaproteobacteria bacterium]|nr:CHASE2 domain-containing protein [Betaproteobacteria bacterium]
MSARRHLRDAILPALLIGLLAGGATLLLRQVRALEAMEFALHDRLSAQRPAREAHPDITVIYETESDLKRFGHPLNDEKFAAALTRLLAMKPKAIVVDKYRDLPLPPGSEAFNAVLRENDNILWVAKHGRSEFDGVPPPKVLAGSDRVGCADVPIDGDGRVRRYMLAMGGGNQVCPSIGYLTAAVVLAGKNQTVGFDPSAAGTVTLGAHRAMLFTGREGPYVREDARGYQLPILYERPPARSHTLSQLFDGVVPPSSIGDRIVLVGTSAISLRDVFDIPPRTGRESVLPGVMLHATAIGELLDAAAGAARPVMAGDRVILVSAFAMALLCAALMLSPLSIPWAALAGAVAIGAWMPAASQWAGSGTVLAPAAPMVAGLFAATASLAWRAWREARERGELMGWFGKHVSPEVAQAIWQQRDQFAEKGRMPPQNVRVSVLFADIRGYTTVSESLGIDRMIPWLNRAIAEMVAAVTENKGVVTRFAGDQVMAVFGVPVARTTDAAVAEDARNAIEAGLAMDRKLAALNV